LRQSCGSCDFLSLLRNRQRKMALKLKFFQYSKSYKRKAQLIYFRYFKEEEFTQIFLILYAYEYPKTHHTSTYYFINYTKLTNIKLILVYFVESTHQLIIL